MLRLSCLILVCFVAQAMASEIYLPKRIFIDKEIGTCFYVPYNLYIPSYQGKECYAVANIIKGRIDLKSAMRIRYFSRVDSDKTINDILKQELRGATANITAFDYKVVRGKLGHTPEPDIQALQAQGTNVRAIICQQGKRIAGVMINGRVREDIADEIIQSFEMMEKLEKRWSNFRERQSDAGQCFHVDAQQTATKKTKRPKNWSDALQVESEHFHITFMCEPKLVAGYLDTLEGLHVVLNDWFPMQKPQHFKYEIHITKTTKDFGKIAAKILQNKSYENLANDGAAFGGFFSTMAAATFTYTDKIKYAQMTPELQLAHEVVHQYMFVNSHNNYTLPMWFNEAIAVLFESGKYSRSKQEILPPSVRFKALKTYYKKEPPVRVVREYVEQDKAFTNVHEYVESYAILHFLLQEEGGHDLLLAYWQQLQQGKNGKTAFHEVFLKPRLQGVDDRDAYYEQWQSDLMKFIKGKKAEKKIKK